MKIPPITFYFFIFALFIAPEKAWSHGKETHTPPPKPLPTQNAKLSLSSGNFPGITWADDIHTIFVRNNCGGCHTRGNEAIVEGLTEFALGLIDPDDPLNPYYSYHELVYVDGPAQIQPGETLRDGQCCWPKDYPADQQRRIWLGHPERSVLLRKLDRDYFNWKKPPRYLEAGLRLLWGLPMPLWEEAHDEQPISSNNLQESLAKDIQENKTNELPQKTHKGRDPLHDYKVRSFGEQLLFSLSLQFGKNKEKLQKLSSAIPEIDRIILRYWIANIVHLKDEGTGIKIILQNGRSKPLGEKKIKLIGNYNNAKRTEVSDVIELVTDKAGIAEISFPINSTVSSNWYIKVEGLTPKNEDEYIPITSGKISKRIIVLK